MNADPTRRDFGKAVAATLCWSAAASSSPLLMASMTDQKPAILGGKPVCTSPTTTVTWPIHGRLEQDGLTAVLNSDKWCRLDGKNAATFEETFAGRTQAKHCLATSSGTTALVTSLNALDIGPGDEVIVPPYTFVATINAVLLQHALPIFVDSDLETFQIDAKKIEAAITPQTKAILPVHLGGSVADLDTIMAISKKHNIPVVEDACQSHLAEWRGKKVGTFGATGCFSFQASKNLNSGEGGAILTNDDQIYSTCVSFGNNGRGNPAITYAFVRNGCNYRMTEFQASVLLGQITRLEEQMRTREQNAQYLTAHLKEIDGISPAKMYEGCTRNAYHLYMFRYDPSKFNGLPREKFIKALEAEGMPNSPGYTPLNKEPFLDNTINTRHYKRAFHDSDLSTYRERIACPVNDQLCSEAIWFEQTNFLGPRSDMDQRIDAILKIKKYSAEIAKA
jgi:perosamine synthetase